MLETQVCSKCGEEKPLSAFYVYSGKYFRRCKGCLSEYNRRYRAKGDEVEVPEWKYCNQCKEEKHSSCFNKSKSTSDGLKTMCIPCGPVSRKKRKKFSRKYSRLSQKLNKAAIGKESSKVFSCGPCFVCGTVFSTHTSTLYCSLLCAARFKRRNKESRRRARQFGVEYDSNVTVDSLRLLGGDHCAFCATLLNFTDPTHPNYRNLEHFIPLVKKGTHTFDNCALSCPSCNNSKLAQDPIEWLSENLERIVITPRLATLINRSQKEDLKYYQK